MQNGMLRGVFGRGFVGSLAGVVAASGLCGSALAQESKLDRDWISALTWREIGPANMSGRIIDIDVYPGDHSIWYVSTASGGLLKTTNMGTTFTHHFDSENTVSIGATAVAATDPDLVWIGTGERNPRNSVSWGDGVYKSIDGGATWEHMGLDETFQTGDVIIHPEDHDIVYVGAMGRLWGTNEQRGLFKTTDGGETWRKVLYVDDTTGVIDLAMHPENPDIMLAAMWERQRDEFDTNDPAKRWGPGSGLYRTSDGGETWAEVTEGLPTVDKGRMGIDWSVSNPDNVYMLVDSVRIGEGIPNPGYMGITGQDAEVGARLTSVVPDGPAQKGGLEEGDIVVALDGAPVISYDDLLSEIRIREAGTEMILEAVRGGEVVEVRLTLAEHPDPNRKPFERDLGGQRGEIGDQQGEDGFETGGLFKSEDAGATWTRINSINPRPMYFSKIFVDPSDENHIWVHGIPMSKSDDGGKTFRRDGTSPIVHVDHHSMWIDPNNGEHVILGNDGGLYETWDRGRNWTHHNKFAIGQYYHVTVDNRAFYNVYGGFQDNGSWGGPNQSRDFGGTVNTDWFRIGGGDGFICAADPEDPDQLYYASQNGGIGRVHLTTGERRGLRPRAPRGMSYRFNWKTPYMLSHHNSKVYYTAGNYVFRSLFKGDDMQRISPQIVRTRRGTATAFDESPIDQNIMYVGSDDGAVWVTRDGGSEWENLIYPFDPDAFEDEDADEASDEPSDEPAAAPLAGDPVAGVWEGELEGGIADFTMTLTRASGGALRARVDSPAGDASVSDLVYNDERGVLTLTINTDFGSARMNATIVDGIMTGTISSEDLGVDSKFTALRVRAATPAPPPAPVVEVDEAPAPVEQPVEAPAFNLDDPIEGEWDANLSPAQGNGFTLTFRRLAENRIRAEIDATTIDDANDAGSFDPERSRAVFTFRGTQGEIVFNATVEGDRMTGSLAFSGGGFESDFEATRRRGDAQPQETEDAGNTLSDILPGPRRVTSIEASRFARERVYMTLAGYYYDDDNPYVLMSEDAGKTWSNISSNLPEGSTRVVREDLFNENVLYCGTEFALWVSIDRGSSWTRLNSNLPTVAIHEIAQHETSGEIIAGTHGRSAWALDVTPIRQMSSRTITAEAHLYTPNTVVRWRRTGSRGRGGDGWFSGELPSGAAQIFYSLTERADDLTIEIRDISGDRIASLDVPSTREGLHVVTWDTRREPPQGGNARFRRGPLVEPGVYRVVMKAGDVEMGRDLRIIADPESPDGRAFALDEFMEELYNEEEDGVEKDQSSLDH